MGSINMQVLIGNVGRAPELTYSQSGTPITNFSIATEHRVKKANGDGYESVTTWHRLVAFNALAETIAKHVKAGDELSVIGRTQHRSFTDKDGVERQAHEVVVNTFGFNGNLNLAVVAGNVGSDPRVTKTTDTAIANLSIATSHSTKKPGSEEFDRVTTWHDAVCFKGMAGTVEEYVKKGGHVAVVGQVRTRSYEAADGSKRTAREILVNDLALLRKPDGTPKQDAQNDQSADFENDSIPF